MSKALSIDLRVRVLAAVSGGATHREAAERFGVSAASVSRWRNLQLRQGDVQPGQLGGDRNSHKTEAHGKQIMTWLAEHRDGTLFELHDALAQQCITISKSALHRFLVRHGQTRKKDWPCGRAEPPRRLGAAPALVRRPTGPRSRAAHLH